MEKNRLVHEISKHVETTVERNIHLIKASVARLVVEFFAIGTGAQGYRLLTRNAPLSEKTP